MDIRQHHPAFDEFVDAWRIMRDAIGGEDIVKEQGTKYLPMKSAQAAMKDKRRREASYLAYKLRAEFPEIVAPTITGQLGLIHSQPLAIELPPQLEPLRERATAEGLTLDEFAESITAELLAVGRYGVLPTFVEGERDPLLAGFATEAIINWEVTSHGIAYLVLDESSVERDPATGIWQRVDRFRELRLQDGVLVQRLWSGDAPGADEPVTFGRTSGGALDFIPFVAIGTRSATIKPDDVPLYGLAKIALRMYRLDADYMQSLHMTSEPTPYVTGFDDPVEAAKDGRVPSTVGSSSLWVLPPNATAGFLEFQGAGLAAQRSAIDAAREAAATFGARMFDETNRAPESGESRKLRYGQSGASLKTIARVTAAGLERALRNQARWLGLAPETVTVTPNLDWVTDTMTPAELTALTKAWQDGVISYETLFERMQAGKIVKAGRTLDEEVDAILDDALRSERDEPEAGSEEAGSMPAKQQQPAAELAITTET